jgi:hypothetical protein
VVDSSSGTAEPSVYVFGRYTNLPLVSRLGTIMFSGPMRLVLTSIHNDQSSTEIKVRHLDGRPLFNACLEAKSAQENSKLFETTDDFVSFIKEGRSSYTPSNNDHRYSRVDLVEDSNHYEPVSVRIDYNVLDYFWRDARLVFDSSFHATGGRYVLSYLGSVR